MKRPFFWLGLAFGTLYFIVLPISRIDWKQMEANRESIERCVAYKPACEGGFLKWHWGGSIERLADCGDACLPEEYALSELQRRVRRHGPAELAARVDWVAVPADKHAWEAARAEFVRQYH